jgi:hypothetical protein
VRQVGMQGLMIWLAFCLYGVARPGKGAWKRRKIEELGRQLRLKPSLEKGKAKQA